jgi:hypothetical protein
MNKNKQVEEIIEDILSRFITQKCKREDGIVEIDFRPYIKALTQLIEEREKEAVRGFAEWLRKDIGHSESGDYIELVEEYLSTTKEEKK